MIEIYYSPTFYKAYKKLPESIKNIAEMKMKIFRKVPYDSSLKIHKLSGKLKDYWAFSINYKYRIIFSFISDHKIYFHTIGTHEIYNNFNH